MNLKNALLSALLLPLLFTPASAQLRLTRDVPLKLRDGVILRADVYETTLPGKHNVLLVRTPYNKAGEASTCVEAAQHGYICIAQDVRGRFASEGVWYPFLNESNDGYDTIEWAAALPSSSGKVAMFGESYVGATLWLAAISHPPHLVALQPSLTPSDYYDAWIYQGGAFEQWFNQCWSSYLTTDALARATSSAPNTPKDWDLKLPLSAYPILPPTPPAPLAPYYFHWLQHPTRDDYWQRWSIQPHYSELPLAALHVAGWYDMFLRGALRNYVGMRTHAATPWARAHQQLVIGPWLHQGDKDGKAGELDFGPAASLDHAYTPVPWYDRLFADAPSQASAKPVHLFIMGINRWRDEEDWPLPRTQYTPYYLHSQGHSNSSAGDGSLSPLAPLAEPADAFTFDPANPVPTRGGNLCCTADTDPFAPGVADQRKVEERDDVLVFTTPAFTSDFEVTGPLQVELYVDSSAPDTDFTAKLVDVHPNGFAQNLADGILRLRYRNSLEHPELLLPGTVVKITIDLAATANVFRPGHRLRLEVSSSNFPRFDRNLNTAELPELGRHFTTARNRIFHDSAHPSAILLPLIK